MCLLWSMDSSMWIFDLGPVSLCWFGRWIRENVAKLFSRLNSFLFVELIWSSCLEGVDIPSFSLSKLYNYFHHLIFLRQFFMLMAILWHYISIHRQQLEKKDQVCISLYQEHGCNQIIDYVVLVWRMFHTYRTLKIPG